MSAESDRPFFDDALVRLGICDHLLKAATAELETALVLTRAQGVVTTLKEVRRQIKMAKKQLIKNGGALEG